MFLVLNPDRDGVYVCKVSHFNTFIGNELLQKWLKSDHLLARSFRGGALLTIGSVIERGLRFIRNVVLAHLLAPDQFGLMALVLAASGLFEVLTEVGVRQAVIQNKRGDTPDFLNAVFWISTFRGGGLYIIGILCAPWLAVFYKEPALTPLLRVAFIAMFLNGLTCPGLYVLEKKLKFLPYVLVTQGAGLAGTIVSLILVLYFNNVWSLVIGFVSEAVFRCIGSFIAFPFWPIWKINPQAKAELFHFSRGIFGTPILTYLFMQADIFILGKMCGNEILGLYSMAYSLASIPQMLFSKAAGPLILPVFSEMQDRKERLTGNLIRMTRMLFLLGFPMSVILSIFAAPILEVVYGAKYAEVSMAFSFMCFYIILYIVNVVIASTYTALGKPDLQRRFTVIRLIILVLGIYPAIKWYGTSGAAAMRVFCMIFAGWFQLYTLKKLLDMSPSKYLISMKDGLYLSCLIVLPSLLIHSLNLPNNLQVIWALCLIGLVWLGGFWKMRKSITRVHSQMSECK